MANVNAPFGLLPKRRMSGGPWSVIKFKKEASVILAPGDPVVLTGSGTTVNGEYIALVTRATNTGTITGVMLSRDIDRNNLAKKHFAAADTGYLWAVVDDDMIYQIQENSASSTNVAAANIGGGANLVAALDANTTVGISQFTLDTGSLSNSTGQLQILGLSQVDGNTQGNYAVWDVLISAKTLYGAAGAMV